MTSTWIPDLSNTTATDQSVHHCKWSSVNIEYYYNSKLEKRNNFKGRWKCTCTCGKVLDSTNHVHTYKNTKNGLSCWCGQKKAIQKFNF